MDGGSRRAIRASLCRRNTLLHHPKRERHDSAVVVGALARLQTRWTHPAFFLFFLFLVCDLLQHFHSQEHGIIITVVAAAMKDAKSDVTSYWWIGTQGGGLGDSGGSRRLFFLSLSWVLRAGRVMRAVELWCNGSAGQRGEVVLIVRISSSGLWMVCYSSSI